MALGGRPASGAKHDDDGDRRELDATSEPKREGGCCDSKHECQGSIVRPDVWRMLIKHMYIDCQLAFPAFSFFFVLAFVFVLASPPPSSLFTVHHLLLLTSSSSYSPSPTHCSSCSSSSALEIVFGEGRKEKVGGRRNFPSLCLLLLPPTHYSPTPLLLTPTHPFLSIPLALPTFFLPLPRAHPLLPQTTTSPSLPLTPSLPHAPHLSLLTPHLPHTLPCWEKQQHWENNRNVYGNA